MTIKIADPVPQGPDGPRIKPTIVNGADGNRVAQSKAVQPTRSSDGGAPLMNNIDGADRWL